MDKDELLQLVQIAIENHANTPSISSQISHLTEVINNLVTAVNNLQKEKEISEAEKNLKKVSDSPPLLIVGFALAAANLIAFPLNSEWVSLLIITLFGTDHRELLGERRLNLIQEAIVFIVILIVSVYLIYNHQKEAKEVIIKENSDLHNSDPHDSYQDNSYQQDHKQTQETDFLLSTPSTHMDNCFCEECNQKNQKRNLERI